jgi:hypothetical protein
VSCRGDVAGGLTVFDAVKLRRFANNEVQIFVHALQIPIQDSSVLKHDADWFAEQLNECGLGRHDRSGSLASGKRSTAEREWDQRFELFARGLMMKEWRWKEKERSIQRGRGFHKSAWPTCIGTGIRKKS